MFEKRGRFEEGRKHVAVGGDAGSAHEVEGGEGVAEEAVRGVAFDNADPREGVRVRCRSGFHDLRVELFGVAGGNHRVRVVEDSSRRTLGGTH